MKQYASFGKRFLAMIIDGFAVSAISSIFIALWGIWVYVGLSWLIGALYFILLEGGNWNATLGKKVVGILVVDTNGSRISYGTATIRYIGKIISAFILFIGYIMAAFSDTNQALHDKLANTFVIEGNSVAGYVPKSQASQLAACYLVGISGEFAGKAFPFSTNGVLMGRDTVSCQIVFSHSAQGISRHHCQVSYKPQSGMFVLNDLGSTYGTFTMNGIRIQSGQPMALRVGERFYLGSKKNIFEVRA